MNGVRPPWLVGCGGARPVVAGGRAPGRRPGVDPGARRGACRVAHAQARRGAGFRHEELEAMRREAGMSVQRFCALVGLSRATW